jgi:hypothetical protein
LRHNAIGQRFSRYFNQAEPHPAFLRLRLRLRYCPSCASEHKEHEQRTENELVNDMRSKVHLALPSKEFGLNSWKKQKAPALRTGALIHAANFPKMLTLIHGTFNSRMANHDTLNNMKQSKYEVKKNLFLQKTQVQQYLIEYLSCQCSKQS